MSDHHAAPTGDLRLKDLDAAPTASLFDALTRAYECIGRCNPFEGEREFFDDTIFIVARSLQAARDEALASAQPAAVAGDDRREALWALIDKASMGDIWLRSQKGPLLDAILALFAAPEAAAEERRSSPDDLRAFGLTVAVHNDYRLNGSAHTFWLFTTPDGRAVKGEGRTDAEALDCVRAAIRALPPAADDVASGREGGRPKHGSDDGDAE